MATLKVLLLVTLFISYCSGEENPPCTPTVRNEPFTDFMKSMNCAVDENLLRLFTSDEVFKNSVLNIPYANFMCIGLMDALTLVPETLCDYLDPLSDIPDGDFCSSSKIAALRKISNSSIFDEKSNFVTISKYTEEKCKQICEDDDTNHLCWAFGNVAAAVLKKHTQSTDTPTTIPTITTTPQPSTKPDLPVLTTQDDDAHTNDGNVVTDDIDGGEGGDEVHTDKPEDNDPTDKPEDNDPTEKPEDNDSTEKPEDNDPTEKPEDNKHTDKPEDNDPTDKPEDNDSTPIVSTSTTDDNVTDYFDKLNEASNNSENVNENPNAKDDDDDGKESGKESHENNEDKDTDTEEHPDKGPTDVVLPTGNNGADDNHTHPLEVGGVVGNQTVSSTEDQSQPDGTELGSDATDTHTEDGTENEDDAQDSNGQGLDSSQDITDLGPDSSDDSTDQNPDQGGVDFDDDDDDDGYSYWHFAAILLFILFLGVAGYLASLNRKKIRESVSTYMSKRKRKREYKPVNTMEAGLS